VVEGDVVVIAGRSGAPADQRRGGFVQHFWMCAPQPPTGSTPDEVHHMAML